MVLWGCIRRARVEGFSHHCKRWYSQIYGINLMNGAAGGRRIGILRHGRMSEQFAAVRSFAAPVQSKPKREEKDTRGPRLNRAITAEFVRLVTDEGHNVVSRREALDRAMKLKLDLVEVQRNAKPPVCKIMDFHRELYKQQLKEKDRSKSKSALTLRKGDCKEVRFTGKTEQKDLQMKADMVKRLMDRGYRVKCMAMGTEEEDLGGLLSRLSALLEDVAFVESGPRVERRQAYAIVRHIKFGSTKKSPVKKAAKIVEATSSKVQTAAATPMFASSGPVQVEGEWEHNESGSETEEGILSDEDDDALDSSKTHITTPVEEPEEEFSDKMAWSAVDKGDGFDKVFGFDGDSSSTTSRFIDNNTMDSVNDSSSDVTKLLSKKLPFTSVGTGQEINQGWNFQKSTIAGPTVLKQTPDAVNGKLGPRNGQKGREIIPDKVPSHLEDLHVSENRYSRNGLKSVVQQMQSTAGISRVIDTKVHSQVPESAVQRSQINTGGLRVSDVPEPQNRSPSPIWQPRPTFNSKPMMTQNPKNTDNSSLRNMKPPSLDESRKQPQLDTKQGPSLSSYGIFSAPKTAAFSNQKISTEVNGKKERNTVNLVKSPGSSGIGSNANPLKQEPESPRQDADKTRQAKWGIFSSENSGPNQRRNSDNQMKEQR